MELIAEEKLDKVLTYLDNDEKFPENIDNIRSHLDFNIDNKELLRILQKLITDNCVDFTFGTSEGKPNNLRYYYITYHGRLFLSRGGYHQETIFLIRKKRWMKLKTITAAMNAIAIIIIAAWGLYIAYQSMNKDEEIQQLKQIIEDLKKE